MKGCARVEGAESAARQPDGLWESMGVETLRLVVCGLVLEATTLLSLVRAPHAQSHLDFARFLAFLRAFCGVLYLDRPFLELPSEETSSSSSAKTETKNADVLGSRCKQQGQIVRQRLFGRRGYRICSARF